MKKDKMKTVSAKNEFRFEEAQIKILAHNPKVAITMDNIISKFPVLAVRIFDSLDDENFVYCKAVNKSWSAFTNNDELFFFKRMRITLKKLIKGCKDFKVFRKVTDINPKDDKGSTPLHAAAGEGHLEICQDIISRLIMNNITDINPTDNVGWTPLHVAAAMGQFAVQRPLGQAMGRLVA